MITYQVVYSRRVFQVMALDQRKRTSYPILQDYLRIMGWIVGTFCGSLLGPGDSPFQRLLNGVRKGRNIRWTAIAMHLDHGRPYVDPVTKAENYQRQMDSRARKSHITPNGLHELSGDEVTINGEQVPVSSLEGFMNATAG